MQVVSAMAGLAGVSLVRNCSELLGEGEDACSARGTGGHRDRNR